MRLFGLIDCNNFYVSCERAFQPHLENKPTLVLSNNDGCVIARSNEVKKLGVKMGAPFFKIKQFCEQEGIEVFSSNYALYADMSSRVMSIIRKFEPFVEVYSIDEAFITFESEHPEALEEYFIRLRAIVLQSTGIPISIGVSTSKTLSKVANHVAKKERDNGVCIVTQDDALDSVLKRFPVGDVWGVGRRFSKRLQAIGVDTAFDLKNSLRLREQFGVVLARTVEELKGIPCQSLEKGAPKKSIVCSRSFGERVSVLSTLEEAVCFYASQACEKLRAQESVASCIHVFLEASAFTADKQYSGGVTYPLPQATSDTRVIITAAKSIIKKLYRSGVPYKKAGVMLMEISNNSVSQGDLFLENASGATTELMQTIDGINARWGRSTLFFGAQGGTSGREWKMKSDLKTKSYTSAWDDLPEAS